MCRRDYPWILLFAVFMTLAFALFGYHRKKGCEEKGGVWFGREWTCIRGEKIPLP